jgi:hypothetical protein
MHGQKPFRGLTKYLARLNFGPGARKLSQHLTCLPFVFDMQAAFAGLSVEG